MNIRKFLLLLCCFSLFTLWANNVENRNGSKSIFNSKENIVEKTNHVGLSIWKSPIVPVKENLSYTGNVKLSVLIKNTGSIASIRLVLLDSNKKVIDVIAEAGSGNQSLFGLGTYEFSRISSAKHKAKFMRIEVALAGNQSKVKVVSYSIVPTIDKGLFKGIYTKKAAAPSREKVLSKLKNLPQSTAKVIKQDGRLRLVVDNKIVPITCYKGAIDYKEVNQAGINVILSFNAGLSLYWSKMSWDLTPYRGNGKFDFSKLEKELLFIHNYAPKARVILSLDLDPGEEFFKLYPDSIFRNEKGQLAVRRLYGFAGFGVPGPNVKRNRHWAVSYASYDYQKYVCDGLVKLCDFLKSSPAGKIVIGFSLNGGHDGQYLQWEYNAARGQADYSPSSIKAFREYIKAKYKTNQALQNAWQDKTVTFDNASLFTEKEWKSRKIWNTSKLGLDRKVCDGRAFMTDTIANLNNLFARTLKKSIGKEVVVTTYYSSPIWGQAGRSSLDLLAKNNAIDIIFQVSNYSYMRKLGGIGASGNFAIAAAHKANLIYLQELDHRTFRSQEPNKFAKTSIAYPKDAKDYKNQIYRDAGSTLALGGDGFYFYDMFGSWFNDPAILKAISTTNKAANWALKYGATLPRSQVAILVDEKERVFRNDGSPAPSRISMISRISGVTPDFYFLNDLEKDLPDYKLWIVLDPYSITNKQLDILKKKTQGKVLIITGAVGALNSNNTGSSKAALAKLGIAIEERLQPYANGTTFASKVKDPLLENCQGRIGFMDLSLTNKLYQIQSAVPQYIILKDKSFKTLGYWNNSKAPALGVKRSTQGTIIYSAKSDGLSEYLIYNAAKAAGIKPYSAPGNAVAVGNGVMAIHRLDKPVVVEFEQDMEFFNPETGLKIGQGKVYKSDCQIQESSLITYRLLKK